MGQDLSTSMRARALEDEFRALMARLREIYAEMTDLRGELDARMRRLQELFLEAIALGIVLAPAPPIAEPVVEPVVAPEPPRPLPILRERPEPAAVLVASSSAGSESARDWPRLVRERIERLERARTTAEQMEEIRALVFDETWLGRLPAFVQVLFLSHACAVARHFQVTAQAGEDPVRLVINRIVRYAKMTEVGFVYGPNRLDGPKSGGWDRDARDLLRQLSEAAREEENPGRLLGELERIVSDGAGGEEIRTLANRCMDAGVDSRDRRFVNILLPALGELDGKRFGTLRAAIRTELETEAQAEDAAPDIPDAWPLFSLTRGKRAILVGGEPRETNRARIEGAFGFAPLEWMGAERRRNNLLNVRDRVLGGSVDVVIILGSFVGHDADQIILPSCRERGVPFVHVEHGYGITRIRMAVERFSASLSPR